MDIVIVQFQEKGNATADVIQKKRCNIIKNDITNCDEKRMLTQPI
jgi:hypothetical protein